MKWPLPGVVSMTLSFSAGALELHLREVFQKLREKGIKCHPKKLRCAIKDVAYLGHLVDHYP
jgi:hypothetical protein